MHSNTVNMSFGIFTSARVTGYESKNRDRSMIPVLQLVFYYSDIFII